MTDYQKLYHLLFNAVTDARESLEKLDVAAAVRLLEDAQTQAETTSWRSRKTGRASRCALSLCRKI